jgi:hypothetical protein
MTLMLGYHFPMAWPLAGSKGEHKDWLTTTFSVYARAFMRMGPRPLVYPTLLIPTPEVSALWTAGMPAGGATGQLLVVWGAMVAEAAAAEREPAY